MGKFIDLTGQKFGKLTVIKRGENYVPKNNPEKPVVRWECKCDCGNPNTILVSGNNLRKGHTQSCGCLQKEMTTKHNLSNTRLYSIWSSMKDRCNNPKCDAYHSYGGRGISVCKEWAESFEPFAEWSMKSGYKENLSIDRIDVNDNYCPENCRWSTMKEQGNNRRNNHILTFNGLSLTMSEWCDELKIPSYIVKSRINQHHWPVEKALTTPWKEYRTFKEDREYLKRQILAESKSFNGTKTDKVLMKELDLTKASYYKLKKEVKEPQRATR